MGPVTIAWSSWTVDVVVVTSSRTADVVEDGGRRDGRRSRRRTGWPPRSSGRHSGKVGGGEATGFEPRPVRARARRASASGRDRSSPSTDTRESGVADEQVDDPVHPRRRTAMRRRHRTLTRMSFERAPSRRRSAKLRRVSPSTLITPWRAGTWSNRTWTDETTGHLEHLEGADAIADERRELRPSRIDDARRARRGEALGARCERSHHRRELRHRSGSWSRCRPNRASPSGSSRTSSPPAAGRMIDGVRSPTASEPPTANTRALARSIRQANLRPRRGRQGRRRSWRCLDVLRRRRGSPPTNMSTSRSPISTSRPDATT